MFYWKKESYLSVRSQREKDVPMEWWELDVYNLTPEVTLKGRGHGVNQFTSVTIFHDTISSELVDQLVWRQRSLEQCASLQEKSTVLTKRARMKDSNLYSPLTNNWYGFLDIYFIWNDLAICIGSGVWFVLVIVTSVPMATTERSSALIERQVTPVSEPERRTL